MIDLAEEAGAEFFLIEKFGMFLCECLPYEREKPNKGNGRIKSMI